jgi:hypothetical protein
LPSRAQTIKKEIRLFLLTHKVEQRGQTIISLRPVSMHPLRFELCLLGKQPFQISIQDGEYHLTPENIRDLNAYVSAQRSS